MKFVQPKKHILDNEAPEELKTLIKEQSYSQFSIVKRGIQTVKEHKKAMFMVVDYVDPNFPMTMWVRLLPQAVLTLNLLHTSNAALNVAECEILHGAFDYNTMPLAPLVCAVHAYMATKWKRT